MKKREFLKEKPQGNFFIVEVKIEKQFGSNVSLRHLNTQIFPFIWGFIVCTHRAPEREIKYIKEAKKRKQIKSGNKEIRFSNKIRIYAKIKSHWRF